MSPQQTFAVIILGALVWHYYPAIVARFTSLRAAHGVPSNQEAGAALARVKLRLLALGSTVEEAKALLDPIVAKLEKDSS